MNISSKLSVYCLVLLVWSFHANAVNSGMNTDTEPLTITFKPANPTSDQEVFATIKGCSLIGLSISAGNVGIDDSSQRTQTLSIGGTGRDGDVLFTKPDNMFCAENDTVQVPLGKLKAGNYDVVRERPLGSRHSVTIASGSFTVTESSLSPPSSSTEMGNKQFSLHISPTPPTDVNSERPTDDKDVIVTINSCGLINYSISNFGKNIRIEENKIVVAKRNDPRSQFCTKTDTVDVQLGKLTAGQYLVSHTFTQEQQGIFSNGVYIGTTYVIWDSKTGLPIGDAYHESPAQNSIQTGIGLISGWACNAGKVEFSIDDGQKERVPYGGSRGDTKDVCVNEGFNGYGTVMAWGLLSAGEHSLQTFVDDIEISDVTFTVVKVDDGFLKREGAEYTLTDFPEAGQQVRVQWRDAIQNFTIISNPESVQ